MSLDLFDFPFFPHFFVEIHFFSILLDSLVFRADPSRLGGIRAIVISVRPRLLGSEDLRRSCLCLGIVSQNSSLYIYIYKELSGPFAS